MGNSLLDDGQALLIDIDQIPASDVVHRSTMGDYTGEEIYRQDPTTYAACVRLAAEGLSCRRISSRIGIDRRTVSAIIRREGATIAPRKKALGEHLRHLAQMTADEIEEILLNGSNYTLKDLAIVAGIMVDKSELLTGGPTSRVVVSGEPTIDDYNDELRRLADARIVDGESVLLSMGDGGESRGQKGDQGEQAAAGGQGGASGERDEANHAQAARGVAIADQTNGYAGSGADRPATEGLGAPACTPEHLSGVSDTHHETTNKGVTGD